MVDFLLLSWDTEIFFFWRKNSTLFTPHPKVKPVFCILLGIGQEITSEVRGLYVVKSRYDEIT